MRWFPETTGRSRRAAILLTSGVVLLTVASVIVAASDSVSIAEEEIFRFFNRWPDWVEYPSWPVMQVGSLAAVGIAAAVLGVLRRPGAALAAVGAGLGSWALAKVFKALVERGRPQDFFDDAVFRPLWEGPGYPSGHAAVAVALVVVVAPLVGRGWRALLWGAAIATGLLRLYTGAHFPLDIVGGSGLGLAVGAAAWWTSTPPNDPGGGSSQGPRSGGSTPPAG